MQSLRLLEPDDGAWLSMILTSRTDFKRLKRSEGLDESGDGQPMQQEEARMQGRDVTHNRAE